MTANSLAFKSRRFLLILHLGFVALDLIYYRELGVMKDFFLTVLARSDAHFLWMINSYYFLSCVAPPKQKSLFAKLKEALTPEPTQQPLPIAATYRSTTIAP